MNTLHRTIAAFALAMAASAAPLALAATAEGHDHGHAPQALQLDHGRKWATDAPLRRGMGDIRDALAARRDAIHRGRLSAAGYRELGATIENRVAGIVADCKLPPEADANLHIVIAELVAAADAMQGRSEEKPAQGAERAVNATHAYAKYFEHPGFKPIR